MRLGAMAMRHTMHVGNKPHTQGPGHTWRIAALRVQWKTDAVGGRCTVPVHAMELSCEFGIYIQALVPEVQVLPGSLRDRAHRHLPTSPAIPCHTHAGNAPESPVGTRVQDYRSFAESPVGTAPRSYRRQNRPFAEVMPGECTA